MYFLGQAAIAGAGGKFISQKLGERYHSRLPTACLSLKRKKLPDFEKIEFEVLPPKITVLVALRENLCISSPVLRIWSPVVSYDRNRSQ